jgi:hypothetical protein
VVGRAERPVGIRRTTLALSIAIRITVSGAADVDAVEKLAAAKAGLPA